MTDIEYKELIASQFVEGQSQTEAFNQSGIWSGNDEKRRKLCNDIASYFKSLNTIRLLFLTGVIDKDSYQNRAKPVSAKIEELRKYV